MTMWLNSTDSVATYGTDIHFDPDVVNITIATAGDFPFMFGFVLMQMHHLKHLNSLTSTWYKEEKATGLWQKRIVC